ncbi:MAG: hypothetical protein AAF483_23675 [Planctomycetota bacterium]
MQLAGSRNLNDPWVYLQANGGVDKDNPQYEVAKKSYKRGSRVNLLTGFQAPLTEDELNTIPKGASFSLFSRGDPG